jgi:hypothetical protein
MGLHGSGAVGKVWSYFHATDGKTTVQLVSYFLSIYRDLTVGDRIHCHCAGAIFDLVVTAVSSSSITTQASANYA